MGLLGKLLGRSSPPPVGVSPVLAEWTAQKPTAVPVATAELAGSKRQPVSILGGTETLEVVGESHYQEALWSIVRHEFDVDDPVRYDSVALLVPEPSNPYDSNAIKIVINEMLVGYLSRTDAQHYRPGLLRLMEANGNALIGLRAQIVGRGGRDGLELLGVFLDHDPKDFGLPSHLGELRTGFGEVGNAWFSDLNGDPLHDIARLRSLLKTSRDPLDRHYMWSQLELLIYKSRDTVASAISEYDDVCEQHHREMDTIRPELMREFGAVPLILMYKQQAIRCKKAHDWESVRRWARRGLAVYGNNAVRLEYVEDLVNRVDYADAKLAAPTKSTWNPSARSVPTEPTSETLTCTACGFAFTRVRTRGRKPHLCPNCRSLDA